MFHQYLTVGDHLAKMGVRKVSEPKVFNKPVQYPLVCVPNVWSHCCFANGCNTVFTLTRRLLFQHIVN